MKNKKSILILIISILYFLITVTVFIFFIKIIKNKNTHTGAVLSTLESRMIEKENFSALEDKVKEIELTHKQINSYFINKNQADLFVEYLENLGVKTETKLIVKNIEIPAKSKNTIVFKVSINGSFNNVLKTISILENISYSISVDSVYINKEIMEETTDISKPKIVNGTPLWSADVTFNILNAE